MTTTIQTTMTEIDTTKPRCTWVKLDSPLSVAYHDNEWGVPCYDDNKLFEMLILEGAQAGLSWDTILNKRENYRNAFDGFDPQKIAQYDDDKVHALLQDAGIVRNRLKIQSAIKNAKAFLDIQAHYGSFSAYIWAFATDDDTTPTTDRADDAPAPTQTALSDKIAKDLKSRGMNFVGSTIIYAFMQAIGMVNDHQPHCFLCAKTATAPK